MNLRKIGISTHQKMFGTLLTRRDVILQSLGGSSEGKSTVADYMEKIMLEIRHAAAPNNCGSMEENGSIRTEIYLTVILRALALFAAVWSLGALTYLFFDQFSNY